MTAKKKATAAVLAALGLESNKAPAKKVALFPSRGPLPAGEKRLRASGFRRARSMTGDQWFRGELLPSWRAVTARIPRP